MKDSSKTKAQLTLSYAIELPLAADGGVNFTLPTVLNPRYNPSVEGEGFVRVTDFLFLII